MSRQVFLVGVGLCGIALAFAVTHRLLPPQPRPGVTQQNCERIRPGMTEDEVAAIFGTPGSCMILRTQAGDWVRIWIGKEASAVVEFDRDWRARRAWIE